MGRMQMVNGSFRPVRDEITTIG